MELPALPSVVELSQMTSWAGRREDPCTSPQADCQLVVVLWQRWVFTRAGVWITLSGLLPGYHSAHPKGGLLCL